MIVSSNNHGIVKEKDRIRIELNNVISVGMIEWVNMCWPNCSQSK